MKKVSPPAVRRPSVEENLAKIEHFKNSHSRHDELSCANGVDLRLAQKKQKNHQVYMSVFATIGLSATLLTALSWFFQLYWLGTLSVLSGISLAASAHIWIVGSTISQSKMSRVTSASHHSNINDKYFLKAFSRQKINKTSFQESHHPVLCMKKDEPRGQTLKFKKLS